MKFLGVVKWMYSELVDDVESLSVRRVCEWIRDVFLMGWADELIKWSG